MRADPFRLYLLLAPILYLAFALLTPPFQTPDEHQHLFRAWQLSTGQIFAERSPEGGGGNLPAGVLRSVEAELGSTAPHFLERPLPKTSWQERFGRSTPVDAAQPWRFAVFYGSAGYAPVGYVPQIVGIWTGQAMGLSVENIVRLGRVLNGLLTFALLALAFRALPAGRLLLLFVGLLPMTAACAGSLGQDGLIIGCCALLVATSLRAFLAGRWSARDGRLAVVLTLVTTLAKFIYLPLAGLALFLPGKGWSRIARPPIVAGVLGGLLLLGWLSLNRGLAAPLLSDGPTASEQLAFMREHPGAFPLALWNTFWPRGALDMSISMFTFGWLNIGPVVIGWGMSLIALAVALWQGDVQASKLPALWRIWALVICAIICAALGLALYLAGTPLGGRAIFGMQGRYYIPLLLPILLAVLPAWRRDSARAPLLVAGLMAAANITVLGAIAQAYYI